MSFRSLPLAFARAVHGKSTLRRIALLGATALFASRAEAVPVIDLVPSTQTVGLGQPASVAIRISGLDALLPPSLGAFDLNLNFNAARLAPVNVSFGDPVLGDQLDVLGLGSVAVATTSLGTVNLFELSLDTAADLNSLQAGQFVLAVVRFTTLASGTSTLGLTVNGLSDADGNSLAASTATATISAGP